MRKLRRLAPAALALILALLSSSCGAFLRSRTILRHGKPVSASQILLTATKEELNERIAKVYGAIDSFQATVDMTPSSGSVYKGQITEIKDVKGFVLFSKPSKIRIIGLAPVVRTKAFDMVSDGVDFRFHLTQKNLYVHGSNSAPAVSQNKIENLRPDAFLASMLVRPADPATEVPMLVDATDEDNASYILYFLRKGPNGEILPTPSRSFIFDRADLSIDRQMVYDDTGAIVSDTRYSKWQSYSGVMFPGRIDINRWKDGYGVVMDITKIQLNEALKEEQFQLPQPEGTQLQIIGTPILGTPKRDQQKQDQK